MTEWPHHISDTDWETFKAFFSSASVKSGFYGKTHMALSCCFDINMFHIYLCR